MSLDLSNDGINVDNENMIIVEDIFEKGSSSSSSTVNTGHEDDMEIQKRKKERAMLSLGSSIGLSRSEANAFLTNYSQLCAEIENLGLRILYFMNETDVSKDKLHQMITKQPGLTYDVN